jgi:hypothetical protein
MRSEAIETDKRLTSANEMATVFPRGQLGVVECRCGKPRNFFEWRNSVAGQWLRYVVSRSERIMGSNVLFFDVEFRGDRALEPELVCWTETRPPQGSRVHGIAWRGDEIAIAELRRAFWRADLVVGYNCFTLDLPALSKWGIDARSILLKVVDFYQFLFKFVSSVNEGSLSSVSALNGGEVKYHRRDSSRGETQKQCQRDVKMLMGVFERVLNGRFCTSRFGPLETGKIWWEDISARTGSAPYIDHDLKACSSACHQVGAGSVDLGAGAL